MVRHNNRLKVDNEDCAMFLALRERTSIITRTQIIVN